jgi:pyruvate, water dikinase
MNTLPVVNREADNLLRARNILTNSGVKIADTFLIHSEYGRLLASGALPPSIASELDRFEKAPLLVRSSAAETIICPNQKRGETLDAIRTLLRHSAEWIDLTVMKIPGACHGHAYYPHLSGHALSYNPYAWNEYIDPRAGVARLVFGLGSRLDDRSGDDFSRIVPLNAPFRRPETDFEEICSYSQRKMDSIDLETGRLDSGYFVDVTKTADDLPIHLFISEGGSPHPVTGARPTALTFDPILKDTNFVCRLRAILGSLEKSFGSTIEMDFSADFAPDGEPAITLTACNTLPEYLEEKIDPKRYFLQGRGAVIGQSRILPLDHILYVVPEAYSTLSLSDRYEVARLIGKITRALDDHILLLGPGRWGTTSPELGIPASFPEISRVSAVGEIVAMRKQSAPEVSMGAHILNELVATGMLYFAVFPDREGQFVNADVFAKSPNRLSILAPEAKPWHDVIKVMDPGSARLRADVLKKEVTGWITPPNDGNIS